MTRLVSAGLYTLIGTLALIIAHIRWRREATRRWRILVEAVGSPGARGVREKRRKRSLTRIRRAIMRTTVEAVTSAVSLHRCELGIPHNVSRPLCSRDISLSSSWDDALGEGDTNAQPWAS